MADAAKKPSYPSKTCPKCGNYIHARSQTHPQCGWVMRKAKAAAPKTAPKKKVGRPAGSTNKPTGSSISIADIEAIRALTGRLGAKQVAELAKVLA